jgi:hypothetical protein
MVICRFPLSNSFLGHPDKSEFSTATGQAALIQINHVRHRTLICRSDSSAMLPGLYCRTQADTRLAAKQPSGGEFRACAQKILLFFFARMFRPEFCRGRWAPVTELRLQPNTAREDASFFAASSIFALHPYQRALLSARSRVKCPLPDIALACPAKRAQRTESFPGVALDGFVTRKNTKRYRRFAGE